MLVSGDYIMLSVLCVCGAIAAVTAEPPTLFERMPMQASAFPWPFANVVDVGGSPPPPPPVPVIGFAQSFGDHMVLQQSPAQAAVYGTLPINVTVMPVTIKVSGGGSAPYSVPATTNNGTWKALLKPTKFGGSYTITVNMGTNYTATIVDTTFGDVWYCSGQSNMALPVHYTMSINKSTDAIIAGKYNNIRMHGISGNMNPFMNWTTAKDAATKFAPGPHNTNSTNTWLSTFSSTCWYYGESLVDALGDDTTPIGLIHTAFGGSEIEQWLDNATIAECKNVSIGPSNAEFHTLRVLPYSQMTLKGWAWYQGENDMHNYFGSSIRSVGYACLMPKLISTWRALWSATPGTTDPMAPFGVVSLAASGGEGGADISQMRVAQTGSYGVLPNVAMPNTFLAHAFDLSDPYGNISCYKDACCPNAHWNPNNTAAKCHGCAEVFGGGPDAFCEIKAPFYMGPIHPRWKKPVGVRLAKAALAIAYNKASAITGPTLSGCTKQESKLILTFNKTLLGANGGIEIQPQSQWGGGSMVDVLVNKSAWCVQIKSLGKKVPPECWDDGFGNTVAPGPAYDIEYAAKPPCTKSHCPPPTNNSFAWMPVDIAAGTTPNTIVVDLTLSDGVALAVRYAFIGGGDCCVGRPPTFAPCNVASCPLMGSGDLAPFPTNPFEAQITTAGKCKCIPPAVCDE